MILASIDNERAQHSRDGILAVVHPDRLTVAIPTADTTTISGRSLEGISMLGAIESWSECLPALTAIDAALRSGTFPHPMPIERVKLLAPLPRTWAFLDGSAFIQHVLLVRKARGAEPPEDLRTVPLMYQGASDNLLSGTDDIPLRDPSDGMDFEAEVGVITDAVPMGTKAAHAAPHVKLLVIMNDVSLRELIPREVGTGFGFLHGKPPSSFAPFALTPDELGSEWREGRAHLPLETTLNDTLFGRPHAGEMHFSFFDLIEHAARTRDLSAGTIIGSGTVSNADETVGSSCLVERRMIEKIRDGSITTRYLKDGDRVRITMRRDGQDLFGLIDQRIRQVGQ